MIQYRNNDFWKLASFSYWQGNNLKNWHFRVQLLCCVNPEIRFKVSFSMNQSDKFTHYLSTKHTSAYLQRQLTTLIIGNIWAATWKNNKMSVRPAKTQISLGFWSESSLSAWRKIGSLATHWAHSEDWSDWADARADLSLRWAHTHFVGFVMSRLIYMGCTIALFILFI